MLEKFDYIKMKAYYKVMKKQKGILIFLVFATFIFGIMGFTYKSNSSAMEILNSTLALFIVEWNDKQNWMLSLARFFGIIFIFFSVIIVFFEEYFNKERIKFAQTKPYDLVVGLTEQNVSLLKNTYDKESVIIIEKEKNHKHLKFFKDKEFSLIEGHTKENLDKLNFKKMNRCIISTGNDRKNIALGKHLLNKEGKIKGKTLHICIGNRDLNVLFKQDVITNDIKNNINIITYSLYENMAKQLFLEHGILGDLPEIINSHDDFSMVLVGSSDLAVELVYHIAFLSTLPNENMLTLYLVGVESKRFENKVKKIFPNIDDISHLKLKSIELDSDTLDFYKDDIWESPNLTNIFIATDDEEKNLEITINLQDTTYIRKIGHEEFKAKVLFALYHNVGLAEEIDKNKKAFANFYSFGNIKKVSTRKILIEEEFDKIAKLINNDYKEESDVFTKKINESWLNLSQQKQDANKTQALHLDIKLLAFGLERVKSDKIFSERLKLNRKIFYNRLENSQKIKNSISNFKSSNFPTSFNSIIDKVARAEHNRWSAFQYLNGWQYSPKCNIEAKEHNCLQPFEKFNTDETKETYKYDLASVYYIPDYLARGGFEIIEKSL